ncbi:MAG: glycosyltransferase family 2 protein [Pirellulaceae bacterium]
MQTPHELPVSAASSRTDGGGPPSDSAIRIAVVIPCHNHARYLDECLESVMNQSLRPTEVVVVDDGSTDETSQVCGKYAQVRYLWKQKGGAASARNVGLQHIDAEFVLFLDADDFLLPAGLEELARCILMAGEPCGAVFARSSRFQQVNGGPYVRIDDIPCLKEIAPFQKSKLAPHTTTLSRDIAYRLLKSSFVPQCSALIRRRVFDQVGPWDETLSSVEDREMWVRISANIDMAFSSNIIAMVRRHDGNQSQGKHWIANHQNIVRLLTKVWRSSTYSDGMRRCARRQLASTTSRLAARLVETGDYRGAYRAVCTSLSAGPIRARSWARLLQCSFLIGFSTMRACAERLGRKYGRQR